MHVTGAVRGDDHDWWNCCAKRAELGDGHRIVGKNFQQKCLEFVVSAIKFIDEQNGCNVMAIGDRVEERAAHQKAFAVELILDDSNIGTNCSGRLGSTQVKQLPRVVPLVQCL